jgi:hypothetical protein
MLNKNMELTALRDEASGVIAPSRNVAQLMEMPFVG